MFVTPTLRIKSAERGERAHERALGQLAQALHEADAIVIGAGAGLSTAAGFTYTGARFDQWFGDFAVRYGFTDMYSGGFYPFATAEERWAYWSRYIWCNRYNTKPAQTYVDLFDLVRDRDYFILTTNVDHQFQHVGFDKQRLFYMQGDYGLFQCEVPCHAKTYDNEITVRAMLEAQGFRFGISPQMRKGKDHHGLERRETRHNPPSQNYGNGIYLSKGTEPLMSVPTELVPHCPVCGRPMSMNLRADNTFVEDEGWHEASARYRDFLRRHRNMRVLYLELGVGWNTPGIIKLPFWEMTSENPRSTYTCLNLGETICPTDLSAQAILLDGDIAQALSELSAR